ncbi:hypothetical protein [Paramaledivibacter caminithermalis]|jgi:DNA-directed RNA polymerase subunit RPC12/RpoP|uniref:Uncharacterized protein n=1 Tax=Paramaledivibacter caminithermalis (strain DSM 15212 / CIP 107654 / DViRD3) TaxID=1121301 RepID=A0A1M6Q5J7_PARC5|nr:hypothetical protein [Paramaledivibacter caminithermalis]SHK15408.1 hypothetical protein SAMN02745912_02433 [Paramaledivibacter caminithermalis DSM 15212]
MEQICPLCNGLQEYEVECEECKGKMIDKGRMSDYYDNYSSYLDMNITELIDGVQSDKCVHLFSCSDCKNDKRITIDKVIK